MPQPRRGGAEFAGAADLRQSFTTVVTSSRLTVFRDHARGVRGAGQVVSKSCAGFFISREERFGFFLFVVVRAQANCRRFEFALRGPRRAEDAGRSAMDKSS